MDFSVNYYNNEYNKQYLFDEEIYLKYPGFSASLDEMVTMPKIKKILRLACCGIPPIWVGRAALSPPPILRPL